MSKKMPLDNHTCRNTYANKDMPGKMEVRIILLIGVTLFVFFCLFFYNQPHLDMQVSQSAFSNGYFPSRIDATIIYSRKALLWSIALFYVVVTWCGLKAYNEQKKVLSFAWHKWAFLGTTALIGPVLLINVMLKGNWGRARPQDVVEFGGSWDFTQFWMIGWQCRDNCSFASGEVAGVAMIFFSLALLLGRMKRYLVLGIGLIACGVTGWMRIVMGSHFLSDTILAAVMMLIVVPIIYHFFYLREHAWFSRLDQLQQEKLDKRKKA